jgi:hypothetical protein
MSEFEMGSLRRNLSQYFTFHPYWSVTKPSSHKATNGLRPVWRTGRAKPVACFSLVYVWSTLHLLTTSHYSRGNLKPSELNELTKTSLTVFHFTLWITWKNAVFWNVVPCSPCVNRRFGETPRHHIPENCILHSHRRETLKSYMDFVAANFVSSLEEI